MDAPTAVAVPPPPLSSLSSNLSFPEALLQPAKCLVTLTGLDIRNNAVHMAIWDLFKAGRRGERKPISYRHVTADHLYPKKRVVDTIDESSLTPPLPNGILKLGWFKKHTFELPAVVVFFYDLDWDHPQWEEKVTECASKVQVIRSSLEGHSTELCVALIQSVRPIPTSSNSKIPDQASQLCTACGLASPNLFIMPYVDRPEGYINRLEAAFYEQALRYYGNHAKKIRIVKDHTNRQQQLLAVGNHFKLAFFTELKQDYKEALKQYTNAYKYLTDIMWLSEDRIMEFKMIAGFLNYKVCRFMFEIEDPRNALSHFQQHLDLFRSDKGPDLLLFQHMEWMSTQYIAFGNLFADAVRKSLRPILTQHPGLYYYEAVQYLLSRRKLQQIICKQSYESLPHPLPAIPIIEYYGQRAWRVGLNDSQSSNSELQDKVITILQAEEYTKDFSYHVILYLNEALDHFKQLQHQTDNMINHLTVLLGEEYYTIRNYRNSLALLEKVVVAYRSHKWWKLLAHLLYIMLKCSYMLGDVYSYVSIALELTSRFLPVSEDEKMRIQNNLNLILKGHPPHPEIQLNLSENESIQDIWFGNLAALSRNEPEPEEEKVIEISSLSASVEYKALFTEHSYTSDSPVQLFIYLRSSAPLSLTFNKIQVHLDNPACNKWCFVDGDVVLEPGQISQLQFSFPALSETFQVLSIDAYMGQFKLVWKGGANEQNQLSKDWHWNKIKNRPSTLILQREPKAKLTLEHSPPILLSEMYSVTVRVKNDEEKDMRNILILAMFLLDQQKQSKEGGATDNDPPIQLFSSTSTQQESQYCVEMSCDCLKPGEEFQETFFVKSPSIGTQKINVAVSYKVDCVVREEWEPVQCTCDSEELMTLETVAPLRVSHKIMNMKFQAVDTVFYDEPFMLQSSVHCLAPWQLTLITTQHQWNERVTCSTQLPAQLNGLSLKQQDVATELQCIHIQSQSPSPSDIQLHLGSYRLWWKREDDKREGMSVKVPLPQVTVKHLPYSITADFPAYATQHELVTISFKISNKTIYVQEFDAHLVINNDSFTCSGNKLSRFRVLPLSTHPLSFNLFPLNTGHVTFPQLEVTCISQPKLDERVLRGVSSTLPISLFVMPQNLEKSSPSSSVTSSLTAAVTASV